MKSIDTLVKDIEAVVEGKGGWSATVADFLKNQVSKVLEEAFSTEKEPRTALRLSSIGRPCKRQLWYVEHHPDEEETLSAEVLGTFLYGHILEAVVISLAMAAGHRVEALQETVSVFGVPGHLDLIIDGVLVDVKSASSFNFQKFAKHQLREKDDFGYISQLSSYATGLQKDPRLISKDTVAFLAISKERFKLVLDVYNVAEEIKNKKAEIEATKSILSGPLPPRRFSDKEDGKSGNRILDTPCTYCGFKHKCWPGLRVFDYAHTGPKYFTEVKKEPRVDEIKRDTNP